MNHFLTPRMQIDLDTVLYLEGEGNYTFVVLTDGRRLLLSKSISFLLPRLPADFFLRLSKKHVINLSFLNVISFNNQERHVRLSTGLELEVSRRRATQMRRLGLEDSFLKCA